MPRKCARVLSISIALVTLLLGVLSGSVSAHSHQKLRPANPFYHLNCTENLQNNGSSIFTSNGGNDPGCIGGNFDYEPLSPGNNQAVGSWSFFTNNFLSTCDIDAWFPFGALSSDTNTRYDFWFGTRWLAWPGQDINQNTAPAGWNRIATNLTVNAAGNSLIVTAHDDGGTGNLALAAVQFNCTQTFPV